MAVPEPEEQNNLDNGEAKKERNGKTVTIPEVAVFHVEDTPEEDSYWARMQDVRNFYYVLAFWLIVWNAASLMFEITYYLVPSLIIFLGLLTIACGYYLHLIALIKKYRLIMPIIAFTVFFIIFTVYLIKEVIMTNYQKILGLEKRPRTFIAIGNVILLLFVIYLNIVMTRIAYRKNCQLCDAVQEKVATGEIVLKKRRRSYRY